MVKFDNNFDKKLIIFSKGKATKESYLKEFKCDWTRLKKRLELLNILPNEVIVRRKRIELRKLGKFQCVLCKNILDICFQKVYEYKINNYCITCSPKISQQKTIKYRDNISQTSYIRKRLRSSKTTSIKRNFDFTLTVDDIVSKIEKQNNLCFYSKLPLVYCMNDPFNMSIDRVNPMQGYTVENTVLCCKIVNLMKLDFTVEEFLTLIISINNNIDNF